MKIKLEVHSLVTGLLLAAKFLLLADELFFFRHIPLPSSRLPVTRENRANM